jgi:hypothetical protein
LNRPVYGVSRLAVRVQTKHDIGVIARKPALDYILERLD